MNEQDTQHTKKLAAEVKFKRARDLRIIERIDGILLRLAHEGY